MDKRKNKNKKVKKGIIFLGIFLLSFCLLVYYYYWVVLPPLAPARVRISNITDVSLTVTWVTEKPTKGGVVISTQKNRLLRTGEFFVCEVFGWCRFYHEVSSEKSRIHMVVLTNLNQDTYYYYRIFSGGRLWKKDSGASILPSIKTKETPAAISFPHPLFSYVYWAKDQRPVKNALVFVSLVKENGLVIDKDSTVSTFTDERGLWLLDLKKIPKGNDMILIEVYTQEGKISGEFRKVTEKREVSPVLID
jgi:hypothetical protein